jgi:hypothetical protein
MGLSCPTIDLASMAIHPLPIHSTFHAFDFTHWLLCSNFNIQHRRQQPQPLHLVSSASELGNLPRRCRIDTHPVHISFDQRALSNDQLRWRRSLEGLAKDRKFLAVVLVRSSKVVGVCLCCKVI